MIFVTIGTQRQSFKRLFNYINQLNIEEKIVVQKGKTKYLFNSSIITYDYLSYELMENLLKEARIVITHGGAGTIFKALELGKKVIVVPKIKKYGEFVPYDHQLDICTYLNRKNYCLMATNLEEFNLAIKIIDKHKFKKYQKNEENFIKGINKEIDLLLEDGGLKK